MDRPDCTDMFLNDDISVGFRPLQALLIGEKIVQFELYSLILR